MTRTTLTLFDPALVRPALLDTFRKLDPRAQWRNPVMFVVYLGSALTTVLAWREPGGCAVDRRRSASAAVSPLGERGAQLVRQP